MVAHRETRWQIESHTLTKHLILRRYLDAWLPIMAKHNRGILFVDGFAGPGRYSEGEEGSPLIALRALLEHPYFQQPQRQREVVFVFIEKEPDRATALKEELRKFTADRPIPDWVKYDVLRGEFASLMTQVLDKLEKEGKRLAPTFAFIDPFGFKGVPLEVIARIVQNPRCECLITFMYEFINRFLAHPDPEIQAQYDQLFGTQEWRTFLGQQDPDRRRELIVELYRRQLVQEAGVQYVRTFEMIDRGNRTEYFLFFGTNSLMGLSKMKQAMWKADPERGQVFSDLTDTNQMVLLEPGPDLTPLRNLLRQHFQGHGWVWINHIEEFVLKETPFSEAIHLKRLTLKPMELRAPPLIQVLRPPGAPNRPGDYPPGTRVRFL